MIADLPLSFLPTSAVIGANAFDRGLIVYLCSGNAESVLGDTVVITPTYNVSEDELSETVDVLTLHQRRGEVREKLRVLGAFELGEPPPGIDRLRVSAQGPRCLNVFSPMSDGVRLAVKLWLPEDAGNDRGRGDDLFRCWV